MQKSLVRKGLVLGIIMLFVASGVVPTISGTDRDTIYVDDDNTQGPWDGTPEHPYQYIQDGIDAANPGDTVFVYNGYYNEYIDIGIQINLIGQDRDATIIDNNGNGQWVARVHWPAENVNIDSFTVKSNYDDPGIDLIQVNKVNITNCKVHKCRDGIHFQEGLDCKIIKCLIYDNQGPSGDYGNGINIECASHNNLIMDTICRDNRETVAGGQGDGIDLDISASGNTIINCTCFNNQDDGISINSSENIIRNCTSYNNGGAGIFLIKNVNNEIVNCHLYSNAYGIYLFRSAYNNISGNTIADNKQIGVNLRLWCNENNICQNNFLNNTKDAFFFTSALNKWSWNYWDEARVLPKPIFGIMGIIPWVNFDWHPAKEPYEIQGEQ